MESIEKKKVELKKFIDAAKGKIPSDLVLKGGNIVNLFTGEVYTGNVAVSHDRIVGIGNYSGRKEVDCRGAYILPGFIDAHIHLESSMLLPEEFARVAITRGTTSVVIDPHEVANVAGVEGIEYLIDSTESLPVNFYIMVPSCVPASELDTGGARITADSISEFIRHPRVLGLAEVMDIDGVISGKESMLEKICAVDGLKIDGHAPLLRGINLATYVQSGISSDHETTSAAEGIEKLRSSMWLMIREGSIAKDMESLFRVVNNYTASRVMFVSDDLLATELMESGHMDRILRKAVRIGWDPIQAVKQVTLNPADYFRLERVGAVAPGWKADITVVGDLTDFDVRYVVSSGSLIFRDGESLFPSFIKKEAPPSLTDSVKAKVLKVEDILVQAKGKRINVIEIVEKEILTGWGVCQPKIEDDNVVSDKECDLIKIAVVDRYKRSDRVGVGFVRGFGLKCGAVASSISHDAHNLVVIGVDDEDMVFAINRLTSLKGGLVVVKNGEVVGELPLSVGGLMSNFTAKETAKRLREITLTLKSLGVAIDFPFVTLSFLSLPVVPELKITDVGLIDVRKGMVIDLFDV